LINENRIHRNIEQFLGGAVDGVREGPVADLGGAAEKKCGVE
jgi:hypothetical protein